MVAFARLGVAGQDRGCRMQADEAAGGPQLSWDPSAREPAVVVSAAHSVAAVLDDIPIFRLGLESALEQGDYRIIPFHSQNSEWATCPLSCW